MNSAVTSMLERYQCKTGRDYENALKEIIQEIALLGLWRAKFFEHAAFYGGTALRILYGLDRFSEDLDFSLLTPDREFRLAPYLNAVEAELKGMGFKVSILPRDKALETAIESAFIKEGTKEHFLKILVPNEWASRTQESAFLRVKFEVDTNPPRGFETEAMTLQQPIYFSVNTYKKPDLFAGKLHAVLQRQWQNRVKGRDYYDLAWYIAREIPVHLSHLEKRLRQSNGWTVDEPLSRDELLNLLRLKFRHIDFEAAKNDVLPFLKDSDSVKLWSVEFFESLLERLKIT